MPASVPRGVGDEPPDADLRPSGIVATRHARTLSDLLVRMLHEDGPEINITIHADSGFYH
jgi:hypothetical protein